jgi:hypothetical protein
MHNVSETRSTSTIRRNGGGDFTHMGVLERDNPGIKTSYSKTEVDTNIMNTTKVDRRDVVWMIQFRTVSNDKHIKCCLYLGLWCIYEAFNSSEYVVSNDRMINEL